MSTRTNIYKYNTLTEADLNKALAQARHHDSAPTGTFNCVFSDFAGDKAAVRYNGEKYYVSVLVALKEMRDKYPGYQMNQTDEASHWLCHNPQCVAPGHVILEHALVNKSRICCRLYGHLDSSYKCPHYPKRCISHPSTRLFL